MNNDIIPPRPPMSMPPPCKPEQPDANNPERSEFVAQIAPQSAAMPTQNETIPIAPTGIADEPTPVPPPSPRKSSIKWVLITLTSLLLLGLVLVAWYVMALRPVSADADMRINISIASDSSPAAIGELLQDKKVIRSKVAFYIYTRLEGVSNNLQAGSFSLSPADSTAQIVGSLTSGTAEQFDITFYPGATLNIASTSADKTPSHRQVLQKLGYTDDEITEAFNASYAAEYPLLFSSKPASADLEGYIYGETYRVTSGSTVKQILMRTFDELESKIQSENLVELYKQQNLTVYEGITLASIIQREVISPSRNMPSGDQKQVAQVFFGRLNSGMPLGSDVTFIYAAKKMGVEPISTLESPYNTRIKTGLPPGPISSPSVTALMAIADPASGDYVYFVAGDDGVTYFARTLEEHESNVVKHCTVECNKP